MIRFCSHQITKVHCWSASFYAVHQGLSSCGNLRTLFCYFCRSNVDEGRNITDVAIKGDIYGLSNVFLGGVEIINGAFRCWCKNNRVVATYGSHILFDGRNVLLGTFFCDIFILRISRIRKTKYFLRRRSRLFRIHGDNSFFISLPLWCSNRMLLQYSCLLFAV